MSITGDASEKALPLSVLKREANASMSPLERKMLDVYSSPSRTICSALLTTGAFTYTSCMRLSKRRSSSIPNPAVYREKTSARYSILLAAMSSFCSSINFDITCFPKRWKYSLAVSASMNDASFGLCLER